MTSLLAFSPTDPDKPPQRRRDLVCSACGKPSVVLVVMQLWRHPKKLLCRKCAPWPIGEPIEPEGDGRIL